MMRPGVVVLVGIPGAGKTTLAQALADRIPDARIIDKDKVRDALFAPCDYTAAERDVSFSAMIDAARYHLGRGRVVVFDGMTFSRQSQVKAAAGGAEESGAFSAVVVCDVPVNVAIERCEKDAAEGGHLAENRDGDLVRRVASEMEEPPGDYLTVSMVDDLDGVVADVLAYIEECTGSGAG
jgi:predicted kinase